MTKYNVSPLVAREIEFSTGTIFSGSWCRYFISITLHQCYIEATWKTRPKNDLDGHKEIFNSLQEYLDDDEKVETYCRESDAFEQYVIEFINSHWDEHHPLKELNPNHHYMSNSYGDTIQVHFNDESLFIYDRAILTKPSGRHSKHLPEPPYL